MYFIVIVNSKGLNKKKNPREAIYWNQPTKVESPIAIRINSLNKLNLNFILHTFFF
jgi:hypothetical protein